MQSLVDFLYRAEQRGEIRFLLIGGRSLEAHGYVRNTKDVDFLIAAEDVPSMERLLSTVGYHKDAETSIFSRWQHKAFGAEDVDLMFVNASTFESLWGDAIIWKIGSAAVRVPSVSSLVALKLHAIKNNPDRLPKDGLDIVALMKLKPDELSRDGLQKLCEKYGSEELWHHLNQLLA